MPKWVLALLLIPLGAVGLWIAAWRRTKEQQRVGATTNVGNLVLNSMLLPVYRAFFAVVGVAVMVAGGVLAWVSYPD